MSRITSADYKVIAVYDSDEFQGVVSQMLKSGYECVGGVSMVKDKTGQFLFVQSLQKIMVMSYE